MTTEASERTIAAVSTPLGEGGIGVIRISGSCAIEIASRCFRPFSGKKLSELKGYQAAYGRVISGEDVLDDAVAVVFRAPHSYTGEDTVELSVHGGRLMVKAILRAVLAAGASSAERGEFSRRAYQNGKIDLAEAESIMSLISADNEAALRISRSAKEGRISKEVEKISASVVALNADFAAYSDFPDEDFPELSAESFRHQLISLSEALNRLLNNYDTGKLIREGINCAIVGKPNVGKSTLMNLLSGRECSIVTEIAGTTRDVIEETVDIGGIVLHLADTAGLHISDDTVEQAGIERAKKRIEYADLILAVFDGSSDPTAEDKELIEFIKGKNTVAVINKSDCGIAFDNAILEGLPSVSISAKNSIGLDELYGKIAEITHSAQLDPDAVVMVSERQRDCAQRAATAVSEALEALDQGCTLDAVAVCTDDALSALFELTGKRVTDEVADEVFRRFCVGK